MDAGEDQNTSNTNGNPQTSGNSRAPQIARMSLYERQAVQVRGCDITLMSQNVNIEEIKRRFEISLDVRHECVFFSVVDS